jgi:hypothetical protein
MEEMTRKQILFFLRHDQQGLFLPIISPRWLIARQRQPTYNNNDLVFTKS